MPGRFSPVPHRPVQFTSVLSFKVLSLRRVYFTLLTSPTLPDARFGAARAELFVLFSHCVSHPVLGGMGHHYLNENLVDGVLNHRQPEALLYKPQKNGRMKLVGVEYIIVASERTHSAAPMLGDQAFDAYINTPANPLPYKKYQLHTWVWKHNPAGMHTAFNPMVHCNFAEGGGDH